MSDISISSATFHQRAAKIAKEWSESDSDSSPLTDCDCILIVAGNSDEENAYKKGNALQTYLLGYEFPSTLLLLTKTKVYILASATKAKLLEPIKTPPSSVKNPLEVEILTRSKDEDHNKSLWKKIADAIGTSSTVGTLPKDKMAGKFVSEWTMYLSTEGITLDEVDAATAVSYLLAAKDEEELKNEKFATIMTSAVLSHFSDEMSKSIEEGKKITHEELGEQLEKKLDEPRFWKKLQAANAGFESSFGDWCYSPIIQSGGQYDLKSSAQSDSARLKPGVILCSVGIRYRSYCCNMGRTYMVDPHETQQANYLFLLELQKYAVSLCKDGMAANELYAAIVNKVKEDKPELEGALTKNFGYATGLEFRDSNYAIGPRIQRKLRTNMVVVLSLGLAGLEDPKGKGDKTYSLSLIDTVQVGEAEGSFISDGQKGKDDVFFFMEEDAKPSAKSKDKAKSSSRAAAPTAVVKSKLRNENRELDLEAAGRRIEHQKELAQRRNEEGKERFAGSGAGGDGDDEKKWKQFISYRREEDLPEKAATQKIIVDPRRQTVILPINGFAVPFHVNTLKSLIKQEEGEYTSLRFMFVTPGQITGKKEDTPFEDPSSTFIRGVTYRSLDAFRFAEIHKEINDLKKAVVKRANDAKEMADVVEQDRLIEIKGRRPIRLQDVQVRPNFDGKKQSGDVEIHTNGVRYQSSIKADHRIDILFNNIRHLFFQPCDKELVVIIHVHLKNPILIGKKKTKDVQFFREVSDVGFDETGSKKKKRQFHDEDELEAEQEERKRRAELNRYFKAYADKMAEASDGRLDVDVPFRELGFSGVPFRTNVLLQPTTDALIFVTEPPVLVVTLNEVEVAHLERVSYGLKNFDLVFVFKDFSKTPIHVNSIPSGQLESVKGWLDEVDISFSEGPVNLNWGQIMKTVNDDPKEFFQEGGWSFLHAGEGDSEGEDGEGTDSESEFDASEAEADATSDSESAYSSDASASDESGSDFGGGDSDASSGKDWDEMEADTLRKEKQQLVENLKGGGKKRRNDDDSDDEDDRRKSKSSSKSKTKDKHSSKDKHRR